MKTWIFLLDFDEFSVRFSMYLNFIVIFINDVFGNGRFSEVVVWLTDKSRGSEYARGSWSTDGVEF